MRGDQVDINAFLQRSLVARVATNGPTLRPVWYLYEERTFYWLTDTANVLHRLVSAGERLVVVVDVCDIVTGEVVHVRARGRSEIIPVVRGRAMRTFARYLGADQSAWDPRFVPSLDLPTTRMCRFTPSSIDAADAFFAVQHGPNT
ncbi:MAG TPA: pyridoxamine 5'-phosphate oxidase family protein [Acidimicrobiales bacterium]|nr:pyridoxamine 5'-phosphate oxidase family protein [Acidimicrobiales bacterium]